MNVPADEGQILQMLLKLMIIKKTIEVGVFPGYSLLATALALPHDGRVIAIDPDREAYETGLPFMKKAAVAHKIQFIDSDAMTAIKEIRDNGEEGRYDFEFVDADKENYIKYHVLIAYFISGCSSFPIESMIPCADFISGSSSSPGFRCCDGANTWLKFFDWKFVKLLQSLTGSSAF